MEVRGGGEERRGEEKIKIKIKKGGEGGDGEGEKENACMHDCASWHYKSLFIHNCILKHTRRKSQNGNLMKLNLWEMSKKFLFFLLLLFWDGMGWREF